MNWLLAILVCVTLVLEAGGETGDCRRCQPYHHHAHYSYQPLLGGNYYNTSVLEGDTAVLRCRIKDSKGRKITWVRRRDWHILSSSLSLYINDDRFRVVHAVGSDAWNLHINSARAADNGTYECQVTDGDRVLSTFIHLRVKRPRAVIRGARQYHMVPGSTFRLHCTVIETRYAVREVTWSRDDVQLAADPDGGRPALVTRRGQVNTTSELTLAEVSAADSGVYGCRVKGAAPDQVKLFVDNADKTAAISRRNGTATRSCAAPTLWLLPIVCLVCR